MPKLLVFVACEKVIIDQENNVSLVTLLQELKAEVPESATKAVAAMKWAAIAMWLKTDTDSDDTEYEQKIALVDATGQPTEITGTTPFRLSDSATN